MNLRTLVLAVAAACLIGTAQARCMTNDSWRGPDKTKHFVMGAASGAAGALYFKDAHKGFATGLMVGLVKEVTDAGGMGTCSFQDFAVTALGAAAGAYGTAWIILPKKGGAFVGYASTF